MITLEVTPEEGEKLALAATEGKLQLALRNYSDTAEVVTKGNNHSRSSQFIQISGQCLGKTFGIGKIAKSAGPVQRQPVTVELIQGSKVTSVKFDKGE